MSMRGIDAHIVYACEVCGCPDGVTAVGLTRSGRLVCAPCERGAGRVFDLMERLRRAQPRPSDATTEGTG